MIFFMLIVAKNRKNELVGRLFNDNINMVIWIDITKIRVNILDKSYVIQKKIANSSTLTINFH